MFGNRYVVIVCSSYLLLLGSSCGAMRSRSEHIFSDMPLIRLADSLKHGFHLLMHDEAHEYLIANPLQLPALYVSALPLDGSHPALRQILYKDSVTSDKMVKIFGLNEKCWYFVCLEFETISIGAIHNESTGTHCRIFRTLDKFGKSMASTVADVRLQSTGDTYFKFHLELDSATFPLKLTAYLEEPPAQSRKTDQQLDDEIEEPVYLPDARVYIIDRPGASKRSIQLVFDELSPNTAYGKLCIVQEPLMLHSVYTSMGRSIEARLKTCYFSSNELQTKSAYSLVDNALMASRQTGVLISSMRADSSGRIIAMPILLLMLISYLAVTVQNY